jgi:hypothetical protein
VPLSDDEEATLRRLQARLRRDTVTHRLPNGARRLGFDALNAYYDGERRLDQLGLAVPDDLRDFVTFVNWPATYVDAVVDRRVVEGFRLPGQSEADSGLWEVWQANDLDAESAMARTDCNVSGRGYYCVGTRSEEDGGDPDIPLVTVESPLQMVHEWSNRKRRITAAARFYEDDDGPKTVRRATLYVDGVTTRLVNQRGRWETEDADGAREEHGYPCPVEVLANQPRTHDRYGRSQVTRIITLTDAACRALTITGLATELLGAPARWAAGMTAADFKDPATGEALTQWEAYLGSIWSTANKDAKFGQFAAADLANFSGIVNHYAQQCSGTTGLPMRYFGQLSDNPPSAEGIRADEARLVQTCESQNTSEGAVLERVMRKVRLWQTGEDDARLAAMETLWRNPATPTEAQSADAAVKKHAQGLISRRQALRDMRYTSVQIENIEAELATEAAAGFAADIRSAAGAFGDADAGVAA